MTSRSVSRGLTAFRISASVQGVGSQVRVEIAAGMGAKQARSRKTDLERAAGGRSSALRREGGTQGLRAPSPAPRSSRSQRRALPPTASAGNAACAVGVGFVCAACNRASCGPVPRRAAARRRPGFEICRILQSVGWRLGGHRPACRSIQTARQARSRPRHRSRKGSSGPFPAWWKFSKAGQLDMPMMPSSVRVPQRKSGARRIGGEGHRCLAPARKAANALPKGADSGTGNTSPPLQLAWEAVCSLNVPW
jgi:hypothetical protein